jgi:hypothetical protein
VLQDHKELQAIQDLVEVLDNKGLLVLKDQAVLVVEQELQELLDLVAL